MDQIFEMQQGGHKQLRGTEPESLGDPVQSLEYGSPTLDVVLQWEQAGDECKTHLCFEFISQAILCIWYPYSCETHKISSKLGFLGLLIKSK